MPHRRLAVSAVPMARERLTVAKMLVNLVRLNHDAYFTGRRLGSDLDTLFVRLGVLIGHFEGRPMTAGKLANYLAIPRTTVLRRLQELEQASFIVRNVQGKRTVFYLRRNSGIRTPEPAQRMVRLVQNTCLELSRMDTNTVHSGHNQSSPRT